jgi:hypothetical protein
MKLRSPRFERDLRRQVRLELRRSPLLWEDYRQHRTGWWKRVRGFQTGFGAIYVFLIVLSAAARAGRPVLLLTVIAIYALATSLLRSGNYYTRVLRGYDRAVLIALPVLDDDYLRHESRQLIRSWVGAFLLFLLAYGFYAGEYSSLQKDFPAVLTAALLQAVTGLCFGTAVLAYRRKGVDVTSLLPFYGLIIVCLFLSDEGVRFVWSATLVTPAGWVAHGFAALLGAADSSQRFLLIPAFLVAATLPLALRKVQVRFLMELDSANHAFDAVYVSPSVEREEFNLPPADADIEPVLSDVPTPLHLPEAPAKSYIGPIEQRIAAWLSPRERVLSEFMLGGSNGNWSGKWRRAAYFTAAGTLLALAVPDLPSWFMFLPMVIATAMAAPVLGGRWPAFQGRFTSGVVVPAYGFFPAGYAEITRVMLKTNLIRSLAWAPLAVVYASALAHREGYSFLYGAEIGAQIAILVATLQPFLIAGHFSSGTNDTRQFNWHGVITIGLALLLLGIMLGAGIVLFVATSLWIHAIAAATVLAASLLAWAGYKRFYERGRVDLLTIPSK